MRKIYTKVIATKDLFLDDTNKKLFTKGKEYMINVSSNRYKDWNIKDDHGFNHTVDKQLINDYFSIDLTLK